jgi:hypothetical protein
MINGNPAGVSHGPPLHVFTQTRTRTVGQAAIDSATQAVADLQWQPVLKLRSVFDFISRRD